MPSAISSLGTALFAELSPKSIGLLAGTNARVDLDAVDAIERALLEEGNAMGRSGITAGAKEVSITMSPLPPLAIIWNSANAEGA